VVQLQPVGGLAKRHPCSASSGTSPIFTSANSPMAGSPVREKAITPAFVLASERAPDPAALALGINRRLGDELAFVIPNEGDGHVVGEGCHQRIVVSGLALLKRKHFHADASRATVRQ